MHRGSCCIAELRRPWLASGQRSVCVPVCVCVPACVPSCTHMHTCRVGVFDKHSVMKHGEWRRPACAKHSRRVRLQLGGGGAAPCICCVALLTRKAPPHPQPQAVQNPSVTYPSYYTQPFHAYTEVGGGGC